LAENLHKLERKELQLMKEIDEKRAAKEKSKEAKAAEKSPEHVEAENKPHLHSVPFLNVLY